MWARKTRGRRRRGRRGGKEQGKEKEGKGRDSHSDLDWADAMPSRRIFKKKKVAERRGGKLLG